MNTDKQLRSKLLQTERQIKEICPASDEFDQLRLVKHSSGKDKEMLRTLLMERRHLLNSMFLCTPAEMTRLKDVKDRPDMTQKELGLYDDLDDGQSWDHGHHSCLDDICICHAIYNLTDNNLYSYPDVLRMNDFWCEVQVTHQLLTNLKGERYSCILNRNN